MNSNRNIQVGDLVVMQNATYFEELNGTIGLIKGALRDRHSTDLRTMERKVLLSYSVQLSETFLVNAEPHQVRLLADPDDECDIEAEDENLEVVELTSD